MSFKNTNFQSLSKTVSILSRPNPLSG